MHKMASMTHIYLDDYLASGKDEFVGTLDYERLQADMDKCESEIIIKGICLSARLSRRPNHMPADSVSPVAYKDCPATSMIKEDHVRLESGGDSAEADAYREVERGITQRGPAVS